MGLRAGLDWCGKSRLHRDSIPGTSSPYAVTILTELSGPSYCMSAYKLFLRRGTFEIFHYIASTFHNELRQIWF